MSKTPTPKQERLNISEEKKYFYNHLIDKKIKQVQERLNATTQTQPKKQETKQDTPDFTKL